MTSRQFTLLFVVVEYDLVLLLKCFFESPFSRLQIVLIFFSPSMFFIKIYKDVVRFSYNKSINKNLLGPVVQNYNDLLKFQNGNITNTLFFLQRILTFFQQK